MERGSNDEGLNWRYRSRHTRSLHDWQPYEKEKTLGQFRSIKFNYSNKPFLRHRPKIAPTPLSLTWESIRTHSKTHPLRSSKKTKRLGWSNKQLIQELGKISNNYEWITLMTIGYYQLYDKNHQLLSVIRKKPAAIIMIQESKCSSEKR